MCKKILTSFVFIAILVSSAINVSAQLEFFQITDDEGIIQERVKENNPLYFFTGQ